MTHAGRNVFRGPVRQRHLLPAIEDDGQGGEVVAMAAGGFGPAEVKTGVPACRARSDTVGIESTLEPGLHYLVPGSIGSVEH